MGQTDKCRTEDDLQRESGTKEEFKEFKEAKEVKEVKGAGKA